MREPEPILVADRFSELLDALLELLSGLSPAEWEQPTVCAGWSVRDVALHLLGDDVGMLSSRLAVKGGLARMSLQGTASSWHTASVRLR